MEYKRQQKVLLVEDDSSIEEVIVSFLEQAGFSVIACRSGLEAQARLTEDYVSVILDLNLPGMDGLDLLRELRRHSTVPVLIISARGEEMDRVLGLELGADDYMTKPFSPRELVARMKAQLRHAARVENCVRTAIQEEKGFLIDKEARQLRIAGQVVELTPTEFELVRVLAAKPNKTFSRDELLDQVWGEQYLGESRRVDLIISKIRQKLEETPYDKAIRSVWGVGYRLEI